MDRRHFPHEHWRGTGPCGFLITLLILSNLTALGFAGGDGISANIFYPALIADLLACVTGICGLQRERQAFFKPALLATTLTTAAMFPFPLHNDIAAAAAARRHHSSAAGNCLAESRAAPRSVKACCFAVRRASRWITTPIMSKIRF
jgi:hypothetical protein